MTSLSLLTKLCSGRLAYTWNITWISKIKMFGHGIFSCYLFELSDKYVEMSYPMDISITIIIKMFVHGISVPNLFEFLGKYLEMSYPKDISFTKIVSGISLGYLHSIPPRAPASLGALRLLRTWVATAFFAAPVTTAMCRSAVAATFSPPRRVLPSPNCHSHWFTS